MQINWRLTDAYAYLGGLGLRAFAWEFLRRNSDYRTAYRSIASKDDVALLGRRWGCVADPDLRADEVQIIWLDTPEPQPS